MTTSCLLAASRPRSNSVRRARRRILFGLAGRALCLLWPAGLLLLLLGFFVVVVGVVLLLPLVAVLRRLNGLALGVFLQGCAAVFGLFLLLVFRIYLVDLPLLAVLVLGLPRAAGRFARAVGFLLHVELGRFLHDVVARPFDVDCRVFGIGILLDLVATLGGDGQFAFSLGLCDCASWLAAAPVP